MSHMSVIQQWFTEWITWIHHSYTSINVYIIGWMNE
jgi:hypothetical protein